MTRTGEGVFPDYERIIPRSPARSARIAVAELRGAIERVRIVAPKRNPAVHLGLSAGELLVRTSDVEQGEASERLAMDYDGPELTVGFDARYLLDVLEIAADAKAVDVAVRDAASQATFRIVGDSDFLAIVMPMRI